jgi:hypothetical protein
MSPISTGSLVRVWVKREQRWSVRAFRVEVAGTRPCEDRAPPSAAFEYKVRGAWFPGHHVKQVHPLEILAGELDDSR